MRVATLILNRNLPEVTDRLYNHLQMFDGDVTDIFVIEAGSDNDKLSKNTSWHADWPEARSQGLRYSRGMNYGLIQLFNGGKFNDYDAFFLLTNDTELHNGPTLMPLIEILVEHPRVGILSPCSKRWGERHLLKREPTRYFWFIHNHAYLLRREFIESIYNADDPNVTDFLFDGNNFRGWGSESELIAKAYANDWAAAITAQVWAEENESHLINNAHIIKTEGQTENHYLYLEEGRRWMRRKYGFNSHWSMQLFVKNFYDRFFDFHPEFERFKI